MIATDAGGEAHEVPCETPARRRSRPTSLFRLFLGGITGTVALALLMTFVEPMITGRSSGLPRLLGAELGNPHGVGLLIFHFFNGSVVFPLGFAFFFPRLPGPWVLKGLMWGAILWVLATTVIMPMVGYGFFGTATGDSSIALSSLAGLLIYGGIQGAMAGLPGRKEE